MTSALDEIEGALKGAKAHLISSYERKRCIEALARIRELRKEVPDDLALARETYADNRPNKNRMLEAHSWHTLDEAALVLNQFVNGD